MSWLPPSLQNWNPNTKRPVAPPSSAGGGNTRFQHSSLPSAHTRHSQQQSDPRSRQSTGGAMSRSYSQSAAYSSNSKPVPVRSSTVAPTSRLPPSANTSRPSYQPLQRTNSGGGATAYSQQPSTSYTDNYHTSTSSLPPTQGMQLHGTNSSGSFSQGFSLKKKSLPPPSRGVSQQQQPALPRHLSAIPSSADEETQLSLLLAPRESSTASLNPFHHRLPTTATISKVEQSCSSVLDDETQDDDPPIAVPPLQQEAAPSATTTTQVATGAKRPRLEDEELSRLLSDLADANETTAAALKSHKDTVTAMQLRITDLEKDVRTVTSAFISCRTELDRERERTTDATLTALIAKQVDAACTRVVPKLLTSNILFPKATTTTAPVCPPVFKTVAKSMCHDSDEEEEGAAHY